MVGVAVNLGLGLPPCLEMSNVPIGCSNCYHMPLSLSISVDYEYEPPTITLWGGFLKLGDDGPLLPNFGENIIPKVRHMCFVTFKCSYITPKCCESIISTTFVFTIKNWVRKPHLKPNLQKLRAPSPNI